MNQIVYFLLAMMPIVLLHELGHYVIAKLFGVKVARFSIGFGKVLLSKTWRDTEWCLSLIPLGGYVHMLDTRFSKLKEEDKPYAFDLQAPWKKILIYVAGPVINLVLGVLLLSFVFYYTGITSVTPQVNTIIPGSLAQEAGFEEGDYILQVNQIPVNNFADVTRLTMENLEKNVLQYRVKDTKGDERTLQINPNQHLEEVRNIILAKTSFGFLPDKVSNELGKVDPNSPASQAGLQENDIILSFNKQTIARYSDFSKILRDSAGKPVEVLYTRAGKKYVTTVTPGSAESDHGRYVGRIGVHNKIDAVFAENNRNTYYPSLIQSIKIAWDKTAYISGQTLVFLSMMIVGKSSLLHISGPISMASFASDMASMGLMPYLVFLAFISISIGVFNLLPIPILDGGGVLFSLIEWIKGKPISKFTQELGMYVGFVLMALLMCIAFFNDFVRIFG